jgi:hypothetical protein
MRTNPRLVTTPGHRFYQPEFLANGWAESLMEMFYEIGIAVEHESMYTELSWRRWYSLVMLHEMVNMLINEDLPGSGLLRDMGRLIACG